MARLASFSVRKIVLPVLEHFCGFKNLRLIFMGYLLIVKCGWYSSSYVQNAAASNPDQGKSEYQKPNSQLLPLPAPRTFYHHDNGQGEQDHLEIIFDWCILKYIHEPIIHHSPEKWIRVVNRIGRVYNGSERKEDVMTQISLVFQVLFWLGLGLWFLGVRFAYLEPLIGVIALVNGMLLFIH